MINVKTIAATAIILIIIIGGYNFWINTPQYSLQQIQKSVERKDRALFDKYVDTNGIIEELVEDVSQLLIEEVDIQQGSEYSLFEPQVLVAGFVSLFQPAIESAIEESFDEFWEDEVEIIEIDEAKTDLEKKISSFQMSYLKKEGKVAKLGLESKDPVTGDILKIEFKLYKTENYWRITKIANLEELLRENMDDIEELIDLDI
tara:strand:- start:56 stop:664 length:609 start_codon:yes stop_codon:yes gene_type:complete